MECAATDDNVVDDATGLSKADLARLKARLNDELVALRHRIGEHVAQTTEDADVTFADEIDQAARHSEQAFMTELVEKEKGLVGEILRALAKFDDGTYGICEGTGEPIGLRRLEARPWARHSVEFKEMLERERGARRVY